MAGDVFLRKGRAGSAIGRHPWIFAGNVERLEGTPADGDPVTVRKAEDGSFLAHGLFNSKSDIRVRLYSWDESKPVDDALFGERIRAAVRYRLETLRLAGDRAAYRIFSSEADGLSGLTVDRYADYLAVQVTSLGLARHVDGIAARLGELLQPEGILLRAVPEMAKREGLELADRALSGTEPPGPIPILEGALRMEVSLKGGQKTGLFLDQRENRQVAARFAAGRRVLDLFCYTGGFGLHCAKAGAREVIGIDSSEPALKLARRNAEINELTGVRFEKDDALNYLRNTPERSFSMVVVDPPRFATSHLHKERALRMYFKLNVEALRVLEPGGVFVTCSCSGRVNPFEWFSLLSSAARKQRRFLRVIEFRGAASDHPHSPFCPESQYLKCVIAQAE